MVHGWDDGDEPWNESRYFDKSLPEDVRHQQWRNARNDYQRETGKDTTRNDDLFPDRARELEEKEKEREEKRNSTQSDGCFVATSAFEGQEHPAVDKLRQYRDEVLTNTPIGRAAVAAYYGGLGEVGARVLDSVPMFKPLVRKGLEKLVTEFVEPVLRQAEKIERPYINALQILSLTSKKFLYWNR